MALERVKPRTGAATRLMPVVIVLAVIGYAAAGYFLLILPRLKLILPGGELDLQRSEEARSAEQRYAGDVAAAVSSYRGLNPEIKEKVRGALPSEKDVPGILATLAALAQTHNIVIVNLDAVADDKATLPAGEKAVAVTMNLIGVAYPAFQAYLADLERSLRLFDIQSLVFAPATGSYSMTLKAYYFETK